MKILMVNNYHYLRGGSERVMFDEIEALRAMGHEVGCFSARHPANVASELDEFFPSVPEWSSLGTLQKVTQAGKLIENREVQASFERAIDSFRPDVVHFHNIYGRLTPVVAESAARHSVPAVMTAHDAKLICPAYLRLDRGVPCSACSYKRYGPAFLRACHKGSRLYSAIYALESTVNAWRGRYDVIKAFICPSQFLLESFASKGVDRAKLRYLPNAVASGPRTEGERRGQHLLYAGRLSKEKGIHTLLAAMQSVDTPLLIAGDGPDRAALERLAAEMAVSGRVMFLGYCTRTQLDTLLADAKAVIVPSECYENAPMAVLEAFAAGKPVVGTDIGGIPEMIAPGVTGFLFPPGNAERLASVINELTGDPARMVAMGENARRISTQRHGLEVHAERLTEIYEEARA